MTTENEAMTRTHEANEALAAAIAAYDMAHCAFEHALSLENEMRAAEETAWAENNENPNPETYRAHAHAAQAYSYAKRGATLAAYTASEYQAMMHRAHTAAREALSNQRRAGF